MGGVRDTSVHKRVYVGAALLAGLLLVSGACGETNSDRELRSITALPTDTPEPDEAGVGAVPLGRFAYEASLTLRAGGGEDALELSVRTKGTFVGPDRHTFTYRTQLGEGEAEQRLVMIGEEAWYSSGESAWERTTLDDERVAALLEVAFSAVHPDFLGGAEFDRVRSNVLGLPSTEEFVNSVRAYHYEVGVEGRQYLEALQVGEEGLRAANDLAWDLWLARDGSWPVRLQATGTVTVDITILQTLELEAPTQWEIRIDVSRPNDPDLRVVAPDVG